MRRSRKRALLAEIRQELGFDPRERAEQLTAIHDHDKRSAKRVLRHLVQGDPDREAACWKETSLQLLRAPRRKDRTPAIPCRKSKNDWSRSSTHPIAVELAVPMSGQSELFPSAPLVGHLVRRAEEPVAPEILTRSAGGRGMSGRHAKESLNQPVRAFRDIDVTIFVAVIFIIALTPTSLIYLYNGLFYSRDWTMRVQACIISFDEFVRSHQPRLRSASRP